MLFCLCLVMKLPPPIRVMAPSRRRHEGSNSTATLIPVDQLFVEQLVMVQGFNGFARDRSCEVNIGPLASSIQVRDDKEGFRRDGIRSSEPCTSPIHKSVTGNLTGLPLRDPIRIGQREQKTSRIRVVVSVAVWLPRVAS